MEKLTVKRKHNVIKCYLSGLSYDEIAAKCNVSKGTVANIISDLKAGKFPELGDVTEMVELLRELSVDLRRSGLTPGQCSIGLTVLNRINECGLEPADIDRWPMILGSIDSEDAAREFVKVVYGIQEIQRKTGLSLDKLDEKIHELEKMASELEPVSRQYEDYKKQITELTKQRNELTDNVKVLEEKYQLLNPIVKDLEKRKQDLSNKIRDMEKTVEKAETTLASLDKENKKLFGLGLTSETHIEFSQRLQSIAVRHDIKPEDLRVRLINDLESLEQGLGLENLIQSRQLELEEQEHAICLAREEQKSLKTVINSLKKEKASLEANIKNTREKVSKEIAKIVPAAKSTIDNLINELRHGHNEALIEVRRLRDEALDVGKEVGRLEEILQANRWLNDLLDLVRGEESVEGKQVRAIVLMVLHGAAAWSKNDEANKWGFSTLSLATDNLIREMEQWKV